MPTSKEDLLKQLKDELSKVNYKLPLLPLETIYALHIAKMLDKINEYQDTSHTKIDDEIKNVLKQHIKSIQDESGLKPQNIARENFFLNLYKTKDQKAILTACIGGLPQTPEDVISYLKDVNPKPTQSAYSNREDTAISLTPPTTNSYVNLSDSSSKATINGGATANSSAAPALTNSSAASSAEHNAISQTSTKTNSSVNLSDSSSKATINGGATANSSAAPELTNSSVAPELTNSSVAPELTNSSVAPELTNSSVEQAQTNQAAISQTSTTTGNSSVKPSNSSSTATINGVATADSSLSKSAESDQQDNFTDSRISAYADDKENLLSASSFDDKSQEYEANEKRHAQYIHNPLPSYYAATSNIEIPPPSYDEATSNMKILPPSYDAVSAPNSHYNHQAEAPSQAQGTSSRPSPSQVRDVTTHTSSDTITAIEDGVQVLAYAEGIVAKTASYGKSTEEINKNVNTLINKLHKEGNLETVVPKKTNTKGETVYYSDDGSLKKTKSSDGKFDFEVDGNFSGILRVQRVNDQGQKIKDAYDVIEYENGKPIMVSPSTVGSTQIGNFAKIQNENAEGIEVSSEAHAPVQVIRDAEPNINGSNLRPTDTPNPVRSNVLGNSAQRSGI